MYVGKKKMLKIKRLTFIGDVLEERYGSSEHHWFNNPPDTWTQEETNQFDLLSRLESKLKNEVLSVLTQTKE